MGGQLAIELEKLGQKLTRIGFDSGGHCGLVSSEFHPKPLRGGTLPSLLSILPCQVNYRDARTSGEEVGQDKLERHNLSYRLDPSAQ
jgi:hypothetical protein